MNRKAGQASHLPASAKLRYRSRRRAHRAGETLAPLRLAHQSKGSKREIPGSEKSLPGLGGEGNSAPRACFRCRTASTKSNQSPSRSDPNVANAPSETKACLRILAPFAWHAAQCHALPVRSAWASFQWLMRLADVAGFDCSLW